MIKKPISVYINWAAYDELSDNVPLTEELAMNQLHHLLRLRDLGVWLEYYVMDCFWFDPDGGYRTWRKPHWPQGPDRFLDSCLLNDVKPALWIGGNNMAGLNPIPAWRDSVTHHQPDALFTGSLCMFTGGFLPDLLETLAMWYQRGVRLYKFDFMNFNAATPALQKSMLPSEIRHANEQAFLAGMKALKEQCPELVLIGYNGFEEVNSMDGTYMPFRRSVGTHWLEAFDALYCGDPRPADVPTANFWRSKDIYSDHMVRVFEQNGFPLSRIDNSGFMIGTTGTCYNRKTAAWQGMLLLSLARGGWVNTYYGNLDLLNTHQAGWFSRAQKLFAPLQEFGKFNTFGGIPGEAQPYGYKAQGVNGSLVTVVNPAQRQALVKLPIGREGRILFHDAGFIPYLVDDELVLGAEQMVLVGYGCYNDPAYDLGIQDDVHIPQTIRPVTAEFAPAGDKTIAAVITLSESGNLRVILRQYNEKGYPQRTTGGSPPNGKPLDQLLVLSAEQNGQSIPVKIEYGKVIWSGLSWAAGNIEADAIKEGIPLTIRMESHETVPITLKGEVYLTS